VTTIASGETNTSLAVKRSGNVSQLFGKRPKDARQAIKEEKVVQSFSFIGPSSQRLNNVAATAPKIWPPMNSGTLRGEIPAKVSVIARANVTAGFANDVEDVNQ
jgi:hypothetical protein